MQLLCSLNQLRNCLIYDIPPLMSALLTTKGLGLQQFIPRVNELITKAEI